MGGPTFTGAKIRKVSLKRKKSNEKVSLKRKKYNKKFH